MQEDSKPVKKEKTSNVGSVSSAPPINIGATKKPVAKSSGGPGWGLTVLLAFIAGVFGAALFVRFMPASQQSAIEQSKQVTLQENSATIDLVKKRRRFN
jgi:hypothetical protein